MIKEQELTKVARIFSKEYESMGDWGVDIRTAFEEGAKWAATRLRYFDWKPSVYGLLPERSGNYLVMDNIIKDPYISKFDSKESVWECESDDKVEVQYWTEMPQFTGKK